MSKTAIEILADNLINRLDNYANDVIAGKLTACLKHIWACQRYLKDKLNKKYYFDKLELTKFYVWSRQFKHRAGILKNQIIEITDFQLFIIGNLFCFKNVITHYRKFRKAYIQVARKNAKSQILALIGSYENFLSDEQSEVYIAGWDKEQSSIVYREILTQLQGCERLKGKFKSSYGKITSVKDGSFIKPLSREARNTGDGTNPSIGIVDEYHAHKTSEIYDVILSGMVARSQPLMIIITTAGFDTSRPCYKEYEYVSKILNPDIDIENEEYYVLVCELDEEDNIKDEKTWIKANPIVATYEEGVNYLRGELKSALDAPEKMRNFLTKNMNKWVDMKDGGYMDMAKWKLAGIDFNFSDFTTMECIVGIDLSAKIDLTCVGFEFIKNNEYYVLCQTFMPEDTYRKRLAENRLPWDLWKEQGWVITTPGPVVDYNYIKAWIKEREEENKLVIKEICYDPWNATQFATDMSDLGYSTIEIRQGIRTLGEPTKDFREQAYSGKLHHNNNPVLTWACSNAIVREDSNRNFMIDKSKSSEKIDPLAALLNAHVMAIQKDSDLDLNKVTEDYLKMMGW